MVIEAQSNSDRPQIPLEVEQQIKHLEEKIVSLEAKVALEREKVQNYRELSQQTQQILQVVVDTIPQTVFWKDRNLVFLGCDRSLARKVGLDDVRQIVGKTDYDLCQARQEARVHQRCDLEIMKNRTPQYHVIASQQDAQGETIWLDTSKVPIKDARGNVCGIVEILEDVTERYQVEKALQVSEDRYRTIFAETAIGIGEIDPGTTRFVQVNPELCEILGYLEEELCQKQFLDLTYPEDLPLSMHKMGQLQERKIGKYNLEKRCIHRDGHLIWTNVTVYWIDTAAGETMISVVVKDISEEKAALEQRQKTEILLHQKAKQLQKQNLILNKLTRNPAINQGKANTAFQAISPAR